MHSILYIPYIYSRIYHCNLTQPITFFAAESKPLALGLLSSGYIHNSIREHSISPRTPKEVNGYATLLAASIASSSRAMARSVDYSKPSSIEAI